MERTVIFNVIAYVSYGDLVWNDTAWLEEAPPSKGVTGLIRLVLDKFLFQIDIDQFNKIKN